MRRRTGAVLTAILLALTSSSGAQPASADIGDTIDGRYAHAGVVKAGNTIEVDVVGRGGVSSDATMVVLNLTITEPRAVGFATVYPCDQDRPEASTINYQAGQTIANSSLTKIDSAGYVCIYTLATTHIIADVSGELAASGEFDALAPARLLDTRKGHSTIDGKAAGQGRRPANSTLKLSVADRGGVGSNPSALAINLTVTDVKAPGFATAYPCGQARPTTSTINYDSGDTVANAVLASVGTGDQICIYTLAAAHIIVDVTGAITGEGDFAPLPPTRILDSRPNHPTDDGIAAGVGKRSDGSTLKVPVAGRGGSAHDATAASINLTVTQGSTPGFAIVYPCGEQRPEASTINFMPGQTAANAIVAKLNSNGEVCIFTRGSTHVIADLDGYVPAGSSFRPLDPARLLDTRPKSPAARFAEAGAESLRLLNELRVAHGVQPLVLDTDLSALALDWSIEMSQTGFRHSSMPYPENIVWWSRASMTPKEAALKHHTMWVNSPGHFRNMTDPRWTRVGVGHFGDHTGWWGTHLFTK